MDTGKFFVGKLKAETKWNQSQVFKMKDITQLESTVNE